MKTRLTFTRFNLNNGQVCLDHDFVFTTTINPASIKHDRSIQYNTTTAQGDSAKEVKFKSTGPETVSMNLVLDGTGVVPPDTPNAKPIEVKEQLKTLRSVVFDYVSDKHEPSRVRLLWGSFIFFGRLQSFSTDYTLFKPNGDPLRAKISMNLIGTVSREEMVRLENQSSPDLNHRIVVREGDNLPLLCNTIYGDPSYYPEVARHNGLTQFRRLAPGTVLDFPPLQ